MKSVQRQQAVRTLGDANIRVLHINDAELPAHVRCIHAGLLSRFVHMMGLHAAAGTASTVGADGGGIDADDDADEEACKPMSPSANDVLRVGKACILDTLSGTTGSGFAEAGGVCPTLLACINVHVYMCMRRAVYTQLRRHAWCVCVC